MELGAQISEMLVGSVNDQIKNDIASLFRANEYGLAMENIECVLKRLDENSIVKPEIHNLAETVTQKMSLIKDQYKQIR